MILQRLFCSGDISPFLIAACLSDMSGGNEDNGIYQVFSASYFVSDKLKWLEP